MTEWTNCIPAVFQARERQEERRMDGTIHLMYSLYTPLVEPGAGVPVLRRSGPRLAQHLEPYGGFSSATATLITVVFQLIHPSGYSGNPALQLLDLEGTLTAITPHWFPFRAGFSLGRRRTISHLGAKAIERLKEVDTDIQYQYQKRRSNPA